MSGILAKLTPNGRATLGNENGNAGDKQAQSRHALRSVNGLQDFAVSASD